MSRVGVISWDWRGRPDTDELRRILEAVSGGTVTCRTAETGSDEYAIVVSAGPLDEAEATKVFDWWWSPVDPDGDRADTFDWPPVGSSGSSSGATT
jgi:hypothetical protein